MKIETANIRWFQSAGSRLQKEGIFHKKVLPYFSVVQALQGSYGIALENDSLQDTGEGGVFLAPPYVTQRILHRMGAQGSMRMQWVFLEAEVNGRPLDELFDFPLLLPHEYDQTVETFIRKIRESSGYCMRLGKAYELLDLLLSIASPKAGKKTAALCAAVKVYVEENYFRPELSAESIAAHFFISRSTIYRMFATHFGSSPSAYINRIRLIRAAALLLGSDRSVTEIAGEVGFSDLFYFSKLFKQEFALSPSKYRREALFYGAVPENSEKCRQNVD